MKKVLFLSSALLLFASCKREGCTDPTAYNYDDKAKKNYGCLFEGTHVLWYGESTSQALVAGGVTSLSYYVDGKLVGSSASNIYWNSQTAPECGATGTMTVTKDLGSSQSLASNFEVKDQNGNLIWDGVINFSGNTCHNTQLVP